MGDSTPLEDGLALSPLGVATALLGAVSGRLTARPPTACGSSVTAHAASGTAVAYADGLSIALFVGTVTLVTTAAVAMRFVPSQ